MPSAQPAAARDESLLVLGNDAVLAARPATPVQLAHAALEAGFDAVVPASWGDELVAAECARQLGSQQAAPALFCACPDVAHRALSVGAELAPFLASFVPPPVALSQYLRLLYDPHPVRLTFAGRCAGAQSDAYDARVTPEELLRLFADRGIVPAAQPEAFQDIVPPDRRRFHSLAGGLPAVSALRNAASPHTIVELVEEDFAAELAQHLLAPHPRLVDAAVRLGCACAGARSGCTRDPRIELMAVEPPRALAPVVDVPQWMHLKLDLPVPLASRTTSDLVAAVERQAAIASNGHGESAAPADRVTSDRAVDRVVDTAADAVPMLRRRSPTFGTPVVRPPTGTAPTTRSVDGRVLPRAYVARRRPGQRPVGETPPLPAAEQLPVSGS